MRKYYDYEEYPDEEKYLYLLLYAPGFTSKLNEPVKGDTWLQKEMHALSKLIPKLNLEFDEYNFGAFSHGLETVQVQSSNSGLIDQPDGHGMILLTRKGSNIAKKLWDEISEKEKNVISNLKNFLNEMSYWELIAFSYSTFPETTQKSEIKPEFSKTRLNSALKLFQRQKISLNKASRIADLSEEEFMSELKKRNIPCYFLDKKNYEKSLKLIENIA